MNRLSDQPLRPPIPRNYVVDVEVLPPPGGPADLEPLLDEHPDWVLIADEAWPRLRVPVTATSSFSARIKAGNLLGDVPLLGMTVELLDGPTSAQREAWVALGKAVNDAMAVWRSAMLAWGNRIVAVVRSMNLLRKSLERAHYERHHPKPLAIDGREYARRQRARRRRRR